MRITNGKSLAAAALIALPLLVLPHSDLKAMTDDTLIEVHRPADFARFAPRTALDMLQQVPGFTIRNAQQARGLGQASGNILINGERLSSKSDSTSTQLARIPIGNVVRIEIVEGASLDIPGMTGQVANVIAQTSTLAGQFEWRPQLPTDLAAGRWLEGEISVSGAAGPVDYMLALSNSAFRGGNAGPNRFSDGMAMPIDHRHSYAKTFNDQPKLSGLFSIGDASALLANLSLSYRRGYFRFREDEQGIAPDLAPPRLEQLRNRRDDYEYEIGGDVDFGVGPGRLKLIGLERFEHDDFSTQFIRSLDDMAEDGSRYVLASDAHERIMRAEYGWPMWAADWQLSGEAAFNRLDNVAGLFALTPAGGFAQIDFPQGSGGVTEDRYELILSYGRALTGNLSLQLAAGGEYSTIGQTGVQAQDRSFFRPKGSLSLAWGAMAGLDISLELSRSVGQLDFGDFLAEVNLGANNENAANSQLVPDQVWEVELEITQDFDAWGSATAGVFAQRIDDYVTIIPLSQTAEARGNIDNAQLYGLSFNGTLQLDPVGGAGAKVDVELAYRKSSLRDPVTGQQRDLDGLRSWNIDVAFRHDLPGTNWAWGASVRDSRWEPYYRLMETGLDYSVRTSGDVFVEHKDVLGMTVNARLGNLLGGKSILYRTLYDGARDTAPILFIEDRQRRIGFVWNLQVSGGF